MMSKVDTTIAIIILVAAYNGFKDGFLVEFFSILAILAGILCGFKLMNWTMVNLEQKYAIDAKAIPYISFAAVLFIIIFFVNLLMRYLNRKVDHFYLGIVDQTAGSVLGFFRSTFLLSVLLWIFYSMEFEFPDGWTEGSWLTPLVANFAPDIFHGIAKVIPFFEGVF
jgi:membrane protein required for colicin V production